MTQISLCFEVHQPVRLRKNFFWGGSSLKKVAPGELFDFYFEEREDHEIFDRVTAKCYLPSNKIILEEIQRFEGCERSPKFAYSFSGVFLEQCSKYQPKLLDSFVDLVETGMVEVMEQTYYHSLSSLYEDKTEFREQVKMHRELVWNLFGVKPEIFENTELLYNDEIAREVEHLGYKGIFAEGVVANPNYTYRPPKTNISLLLRNYQLTDDVGFRFSSQWWEEYPLTANKYSSWLAATPGECINIFCDYETFGEHHWPETGVQEFLRWLPREILKWDHLSFAKPSEIAAMPPHSKLSVPSTISWADMERGTSSWLGNALQWSCFLYEKRMERPVKECEDLELLNIWRYLGLSDHLYYMFTSGGGPGEVHSYFSPYNNAYDAAVTLFSVLSDMHYRLKERGKLADEPFRFFTIKGEFTGQEALTQKSLCTILEVVDDCSLEQHMEKGDLARWIRFGLGNEKLASKVEHLSDVKGDRLRKRLIKCLETKDEAEVKIPEVIQEKGPDISD